MSGLENRTFRAVFAESEIGCLHPEGEDDVQEGGVCEKDRNIAISSGVVNAGEQGRQQVVDESSDDAAEPIPKGLSCQFADVSQSQML